MRSDLYERGFLHISRLVPADVRRRAMDAIDLDLATRFDPDRQLEYDNLSYCPDLRADPAITDLLGCEPVRALVSSVLPYALLHGRRWGQIAIRGAGNHPVPVPPDWHIDGVMTPHNGVTSDRLSTFTALVGVFLTQTPRSYAGNFTVWPDGLAVLQEWFRAGGRAAMWAGKPQVDPGEPTQLITEPGDVVVCNYLLPHGAAVNTSGVERRAIFFRLSLPDLPLRRYARLISPWEGWRVRAR
ncbi:MAG: hypothetical protein KTR31_15925 [Myxococcales bacterium]|nr:hypothetical protein [Myxococcales bacterium]